MCCGQPRSSGKSRRRVEKIGDGPSDGHDTQPAINVTASCEQKVRPPTTAALLVKLDYNAKAEKRLAGQQFLLTAFAEERALSRDCLPLSVFCRSQRIPWEVLDFPRGRFRSA